jgi:hypothetical protein
MTWNPRISTAEVTLRLKLSVKVSTRLFQAPGVFDLGTRRA